MCTHIWIRPICSWSRAWEEPSHYKEKVSHGAVPMNLPSSSCTFCKREPPQDPCATLFSPQSPQEWELASRWSSRVCALPCPHACISCFARGTSIWPISKWFFIYNNSDNPICPNTFLVTLNSICPNTSYLIYTKDGEGGFILRVCDMWQGGRS